MRLAHFYHVYAINDWEQIVTEHLDALESSGLAEALNELYLGVVGEPAARRAVTDLVSARSYAPATLVGSADAGFEQLTLEALRQRAGEFDCALYAHTKGVTYLRHDDYDEPGGGAFNVDWRRSMTRVTVGRWRECVALLDHVDAVGSHWVTHNGWLTPDGYYTEPSHVCLFCGNFWWVRSSAIAEAKPPRTQHRWQAETWLWMSGVREIADLEPGWPIAKTVAYAGGYDEGWR